MFWKQLLLNYFCIDCAPLSLSPRSTTISMSLLMPFHFSCKQQVVLMVNLFGFKGFLSLLFPTGNADEAIHMYRKALQVVKDSRYMAFDDDVMEKMRLDLAELLHIVGRYCWAFNSRNYLLKLNCMHCFMKIRKSCVVLCFCKWFIHSRKSEARYVAVISIL